MKKLRKSLLFIFILGIFMPQFFYAQSKHSSNHKNGIIPFPTATAPGYSEHEEKYDAGFYFINLDATNQSAFIRGFTTIHAHRTSLEIDTFVLELSQRLTVDSVFLNYSKHTVYFQENGLLKIVLQDTERTFTDYQVQIYYQGASGTSGYYSGISNQSAVNWNQKITYTLSEPFQASDWFPVKQNLMDKADSAWIFLTVDSTLKAGSNGLLRDIKNLDDGRKRFEWKTNFPIAYYLLSLSVGDYIDYSFYAHISDSDSILVQNYLYDSPGILENVKEVIDQTAPLLKLFSGKFGMYPFIKEKYGHCMAPMGGGMEHQTMTTISGFDFGIVAHELAHQWFGDYVTCKTWQDIWINEGFASYSEYIALEGLKTKEDAVRWLGQAHNLAINYPNGSVFLTPDESRSVQRIFDYNLSYKKGGAIIHMLRYEINNDSLFFEIVRDYLSNFANSTASGDDFRLIVEKHTNEKYDWFFNQWYYGKGYPVFLMNWRQIGDTLILSGSQSSSAGDDEFFRSHLDFKVHYLSGETEDITVLYEKPDQVFRILAREEIVSIQIDPNNNVLKNSLLYKYVDLNKTYTISPNPVNDNLTILFNSSNKTYDITLTTIAGKNIINKSATSETFSLNLSFLNSGIYILNISEEGKTYSEKILKL
jgi:aminopeptidase N